jgi:hypothetical protein
VVERELILDPHKYLWWSLPTTGSYSLLTADHCDFQANNFYAFLIFPIHLECSCFPKAFFANLHTSQVSMLIHCGHTHLQSLT